MVTTWLNLATTTLWSGVLALSFPVAQSGTPPTAQPTTGPWAVLRQELGAQQFAQANETTRRILLNEAQRARQGWLTPESIGEIPCGALAEMDTLWRQYSNSRFGFTVQYGIFIDTGNRPGRLMAPESYDKFGDRLGWRRDGQWVIFRKNLDYSLNAPVGHLPSPRDEYQINGGRLEYTALMGRLQACGLTGSAGSPSPR